jgi:hypothetical protein
MSGEMPESFARIILETAIKENKAAALLECLFEGGSATVDAVTRKLVLISPGMLQALCQDDTLI